MLMTETKTCLVGICVSVCVYMCLTSPFFWGDGCGEWGCFDFKRMGILSTGTWRIDIYLFMDSRSRLRRRT